MNETHESKKIKVLVTAAGGPSGVNALRLLAPFDDIELYATDIVETAAGRFFAKDFATMARFKDREAFATSLKELIRRWNIDVVFPTLAEELAEIEGILKDTDVKVVVSSEATVKLCDDKRTLYAWATERMPNAMVRWQTLDKPLGWEAPQYFLKPSHGRGASGCRVASADELELIKQTAEDPAEWIVMDMLPGTEWTVDAYVTAEGDVPLLVPRERLETASGISLKGKTVKHPEVTRLSLELLRLMPCWGPVCLQWKADPSGSIKLVEVNPRLAGGARITAASGANIMECLAKELHGERVEPVSWEERIVVGYFDYKAL